MTRFKKYAPYGLLACIVLSGIPHGPQVDAAERIRLKALPMATDADLIVCEQHLATTRQEADDCGTALRSWIGEANRLAKENEALRKALKDAETSRDGYNKRLIALEAENRRLLANCARKGKR